MYGIKNNKVLVIGLPKSGTSTVAAMLRVLGLDVTGPNPYINDLESLQNTFDTYQAFQDYPWCFEYPILIKNKNIKVILLKRDKKSWTKSFKESYSGENENYLSFKYMKISKNAPDKIFYDYHRRYYKDALKCIEQHNISYLELDLQTLDWALLCDFLDKPIPKNIFGIKSKTPKVNSKNYRKKRVIFKFQKQLKKELHKLLGKNYYKVTSFIYRNK